MANYSSSSRSNYFRVKDRAAFDAWAAKRDLEVFPEQDGLLGFGDNTGEGFQSFDPETDEEVDILTELSAHLADGSVAIIMSAGSENLRYVSGFAEAINSKGERKLITLDQIYELAKGLGTEITRAEY